jgi:DNA polymerase III alpha subunit
MLGIYISGHPLEKIRHQIEMQTNINTIEMKKIDEQNSSQFDTENMTREKSKYVDGQKVKYAGIITGIKKKYTKNNKLMAKQEFLANLSQKKIQSLKYSCFMADKRASSF